MIYTIGVYGFSEEEFFNNLLNNSIDEFWDIRSRRGMRGAQYSFVNSTALQAKLSLLGIEYRYLKQFAPTDITRQLQKSDDKAHSILKRQRTLLSDGFCESFYENIYSGLWEEIAEDLAGTPRNIVLFCVERQPEACHRSLVSKKLSELTGLEVSHIF